MEVLLHYEGKFQHNLAFQVACIVTTQISLNILFMQQF